MFILDQTTLTHHLLNVVVPLGDHCSADFALARLYHVETFGQSAMSLNVVAKSEVYLLHIQGHWHQQFQIDMLKKMSVVDKLTLKKSKFVYRNLIFLQISSFTLSLIGDSILCSI